MRSLITHPRDFYAGPMYASVGVASLIRSFFHRSEAIGVFAWKELFPIIITIGAALLGYVAGEMAVTDPAVSAWIDLNFHTLHDRLPITCAMLIVVVDKALAAKKRKPSLSPSMIETVSETASE